ncbi:MAG: helix-turn-helix domain-containing protein [Candidatus Azobacteroides sp.]|nr:helix-turn-helix domain-containing protein [Candidatus Azobacteroides sp.]
MTSLGSKLIHLRQRYRFSQTAIADIFGVSQNAYNKWKADKCKPSAEHLLKLSKYYKINIHDLLDDNKDISVLNNEITGEYNSFMNNVPANIAPSSKSVIEQIHQTQEQISNLMEIQFHLMEELLGKTGMLRITYTGMVT